MWIARDDDGKPDAYIKITRQQTEYLGFIAQLLNPEDQQARCTACQDYRHNQPLIGMKIMQGVQAHDDFYDGGELLDPESGKIYRVKLRLLSPSKLEVRGYLGLSVFGRTQVWDKLE